MATHTQHLHTPHAQLADISHSLLPEQTAGPRARLDAHYQQLTAQVVPHAWNALLAIITVALMALFVAMFGGAWRLSVAHSLVGVLALVAVAVQILHLRKGRVLSADRDRTRAMFNTLEVMDGSRPAPRGRMFRSR